MKNRYILITEYNVRLPFIEYCIIKDTKTEQIIQCSNNKLLKLLNNINKEIQLLRLTIKKLKVKNPYYNGFLDFDTILQELICNDKGDK